VIAGLLLCGGAARRFGSDKLLAGGVPLAVRAARNLRAGTGHVLAVIPLDRTELRRALEGAGCEILETDRTARGMGASLAAGVEAAARADGWIVALGDMPAVDPATIAAVKRALIAGAPIAAPFDAGGRRGHPVGFSATLRAELLALDGDVGARAILEQHGDYIARIETDDAGIFVDIDTPQDLAGLAGTGDGGNASGA
jgi:molybdenum cofactor cytidylyltransferase